MKRSLLLSLLALGFACPVYAANPPASRPSTQPSVDVKALIAQLGAEDFRDRDRAAAQLRKLGKEALPALKEAANDPDPEIQSRASQLARDLERKPRPAIAAAPRRGGIASSHSTTTVRVTRNGRTITRTTETITSNNTREVNASENGLRIHIREDDSGIHMTVTRNVDGKDATDEFEAADADELKKEHPEAFKLYQQYTPDASGQQRLRIDEDDR